MKYWTIILSGGPADGKRFALPNLQPCLYVKYRNQDANLKYEPSPIKTAVYCWDEWNQETRVVLGSYRGDSK